MDWWDQLSIDARFAAVVAISAASLGGLISLISSLTVQVWANNREEKRREKERVSKSAIDAFRGLQKLMASLNAIEGLGRQIDQEFKRVNADEARSMEPFGIVRELLFAGPEIVDLGTEELWFLHPSDGELEARIYEIQQRVRNSHNAIQEYNLLKRDFEQFLQGVSPLTEELDGTHQSLELTGRDAAIAEKKAGKMNALLATLIENLEEDRLSSRAVCSDYIRIANERFGDEFPAKRLEDR